MGEVTGKYTVNTDQTILRYILSYCQIRGLKGGSSTGAFLVCTWCIKRHLYRPDWVSLQEKGGFAKKRKTFQDPQQSEVPSGCSQAYQSSQNTSKAAKGAGGKAAIPGITLMQHPASGITASVFCTAWQWPEFSICCQVKRLFCPRFRFSCGKVLLPCLGHPSGLCLWALREWGVCLLMRWSRGLFQQ